MRSAALCCIALVVVGCAKKEEAPPATAGPPAISLASVAGKWRVKGTRESGDSIVSYELTATADTSGWTINFPARPPIPARIVAVAGDSIVMEAGPYESVLRPGLQVRVHSVLRLESDKLVGTALARYSVTTADSLLRIRSEGTRIP